MALAPKQEKFAQEVAAVEATAGSLRAFYDDRIAFFQRMARLA